MTLDTWNRVEELFLSAADLPEHERQVFLEERCAGDQELRAMIEAMLVSDRRDGRGIQAAVEGEATRLFDSPAVSERVGPYRVEREIGRGGMGAVYLATRDDDQFQKRVAIKVIKRGMDTAEALARFRDERQILANLDHAYIAHILDAGTTSDGRPFFVMEFVEGLPVDVFCRDHRLDTNARCRLFLKICEAVSYAHRNLVIHRDLKPANIFITAEGTPKLLDFGVAKLLGPGVGQAQTRFAILRPLTPEYASPEQIRGLPVTTASDVYSLGLVLYELLTGHLAQPVDTESTPQEIERVICETEPVPPRTLAPDLDPDLDNILLAAMHKDPARRYRSVDQLSDDICRYLESRPVHARKDSLWYRSAKFVRRERYVLGAVATVALSLVFGIVIAISQAREARAARHAAEMNRDVAISERQRAEDQLTKIVNLSDRSLSEVSVLMERLPGTLAARKELVRTTLNFLEDLSKTANGNPKLQFAVAIAYSKLGDIEGDVESSNIGDFAGALRSYRAAMALTGEPAGDPDRLMLWADLQNKIARILPDLADREGARRILLQAITVIDQSPHVLTPANTARLRADLYLTLSRATVERPAALEAARQSLRAAESAAQQAPSDPALQLLLSSAQTQTGFVHKLMGDPKATEPFYVSSLKIRERLAQEHPEDLLFRRYARLAYEHYAALLGNPDLVNLGRPDLARVYYEKARPLEEAGAADSQNSLAKFDYATFLLDSAHIDVQPAERERSLTQIRKAGSIFAELSRAEPGVVRYARSLSSAHEFAGRRLAEMGRYPEAIAEYQRAIAVSESILTKDAANLAIIHDVFHVELWMTRALTLAGDRTGALECARKSIRHAARLDAAQIAEANLALATVHQKFGECDRAIPVARRILDEMKPEANVAQQTEALLNLCAKP